MKIVVTFDDEEDPVPVTVEMAKCPTCGKSFKGLRGVEVHIGRAHAV